MVRMSSVNLSSILGQEIYATAYQRERCRRKLADIRVARAHAQTQLLEMCCDLQKDPRSLDPVRISQTVAEIRYLDGRLEQLEKFLMLSRTCDTEQDA